MRTLKFAALLFLAGSIVVACGGTDGDGTGPYYKPAAPTGGGSTGGGGTTGTPSLVLTLEDIAGVPLPTPALAGTQNAVAVARVLNAAGQPVPYVLVAVASTGLTLTPATGQVITDASGIGRVQVRPKDPFASGATLIDAASSVSGTSVQASMAVGLGAATASLSTLTPSANSVPAYQTIQVSVAATLGGTTPAVLFPVDFSTSCGTFDPATALTDSLGIARSAYRNQSDTTACSGTQTLTANAGTSTVTTTVSTQGPIAANIVFVSATPGRIYLSGSPGISQALLKFKLVDSNNNPVQGANITLNMTLRPTGAYLGSNIGTTVLNQPTNADGTVDVAVNAGPQPGPVQVKATLDSNTAITNVSNSLAIASGLPVQRAFSLSVSTFNIEAWLEDGIRTTITLRIADRLGNPVPDGTTVNFVTEGGQVVGSCSTTGAATNNTSACSVILSSQSPRPADGRLTVLAWAQGEEDFTDAGTPTNNIYDALEVFEDLGQPFLDKNENGVFDPGIDVTVGTAAGSAACPGLSISVPGTCDGGWGTALVRAQAVIVFSGSDADVANVTSMTTIAPNRCAIAFTLHDLNGNPMPAGATLAVASVKGGGAAGPNVIFEGFGLDGDKVPNTARLGGTDHSVIFSDCATPADVTFKLIVTTPKKITNLFFP